jgi:hypothetical protein
LDDGAQGQECECSLFGHFFFLLEIEGSE